MRVIGNIPNLINGISQQSPSLRLPSQAEVSENCYPTIIDGNRRRPRSEHLAKLSQNLPADTFTHFILRDTNEKYVVAITTAGNIYIWDLAGNAKTVTNNGQSYLAGMTSAKNNLKAVTVADYTFIVNMSVAVAQGSDTSPARPFEAIIPVIAGNYAKNYTISVNGETNTAAISTPDGADATHAAYVDTVQIAAALQSILNGATTLAAGSPPTPRAVATWGPPPADGTTGASGNTANNWNYATYYPYSSGTGTCAASPWVVARYHSTLYIKNTSVDFTIGANDGYSGRAMKAIKSTVAKFSDLPQHGPDGIVIKVTGAASSYADDYYVKFVKQVNTQSAEGFWKETVAPGAVLGVDNTTMPHAIVRNADGSFTFGPQNWAQRTCGDNTSVPDPSFVGQPINDIFFHNNRLGLLTTSNVVLSQAGKPFNFFRTTMTALLDSDPIDVSASHVKVSYMRHAVPYQENLILFSDNTQFKLTGSNNLLTPKTVAMRPLMELASLPTIRPVVSATSIYFVSERAGWATLWEFFFDKMLSVADVNDITAHVPAYIPAGVTWLTSSPDLSLLCLTTTGDPTAIYGYKFLWQGQQKLQSAWFKWTLPGALFVYNIVFDKGLLLTLVQRPDGTYLERLNCEQRGTDSPDSFVTSLDRHARLYGTYNGGTNQTTFTLPYNAPTDGTLKCVTSKNLGSLVPATNTAVPVPVNGALSYTAGTSLPAATYFVRTTWVTASGETLPSTETSLAVAAGNVLNVAYPTNPPAGAIGWNVYVSTATGTETLQNGATPIGLTTNWAEPSTGLIAGASLPTLNTAIAPPTNGTLGSILSNSMNTTPPAATYYVKTTWVTNAGETLPSNETFLSLAAGRLLVVPAPANPPPGAIGWNCYVSTSVGNEVLQSSGTWNNKGGVGTVNTLNSLGTNWTEVTTGLTSNGALPTSNTAMGSPTNGALTAANSATYYVRSTWVTAVGETTGSIETSLAVPGGNLLNVAAPANAPAGATGWNVYVATAIGLEKKQNTTPITVGTAWVEPGTGLVSNTAAPPRINTAMTPPTTGALTYTPGGALALTTYYVKTTWVTAAGETMASPETYVLVPAGNVLNVAPPASPPAGVTGWNVYVSTTPTNENKQNPAALGLLVSWVEAASGINYSAIVPGVEVTPVSNNGAGVLVFAGDLSTVPVRFGIPFTTTHRFSRFLHYGYYARLDNKAVMEDGRLQIINLDIVHTKSAYFKVVVTTDGRTPRTYLFSSYQAGDPASTTASLPLRDGRFNVPVMSRNDRVVIDLINDTWRPSSFVTAQWTGSWNPNSRRM